jgi:hypothetical protein
VGIDPTGNSLIAQARREILELPRISGSEEVELVRRRKRIRVAWSRQGQLDAALAAPRSSEPKLLAAAGAHLEQVAEPLQRWILSFELEGGGGIVRELVALDASGP